MTDYKPHFACFHCRKTFKRRLLLDIEGKDEFQLTPAKCPDCGRLMAGMGKDFRAPKKTAVAAWKHIELLYDVGISFFSCGCKGPGYIPNTADRLLEQLQQTRTSYLGQLAYWRGEIDNSSSASKPRLRNPNSVHRIAFPVRLNPEGKKPTREEAKKFWIEQLNKLDEKIAHVMAQAQ